MIILFFKKGDKQDITNHRPISLLPVLYKVFTKVLVKRLKLLDTAQPIEQAEFCSNFSTVDHIHVLREVIERTNEYQMPLCVGFIDYEKALDSAESTAVIKALKHSGVEESYINIFKNMYKNARTTISVNQREGGKNEIRESRQAG